MGKQSPSFRRRTVLLLPPPPLPRRRRRTKRDEEISVALGTRASAADEGLPPAPGRVRSWQRHAREVDPGEHGRGRGRGRGRRARRSRKRKRRRARARARARRDDDGIIRRRPRLVRASPAAVRVPRVPPPVQNRRHHGTVRVRQAHDARGRGVPAAVRHESDGVGWFVEAVGSRRGRVGGEKGETASHTTPFAWCTPFLKDFPRRHSSPALPFQRLTGKTFD